MEIVKSFAGLTAVLTEEGVSIFWDAAKTKLQRRAILGNAGNNGEFRYRNVSLPFDLWSFGFTESDLNSCGWGTSINLASRQPQYGTR